ncbi:MAG: DinB family protein [Chloroflexota bacterium]
MKSYDWVEREFKFDLPAGMFSSTVERARGGPAHAEDIVRDLPTEVLITQHDDEWSIQENIGHLLDLEALWMKRLDELMAGAAQLTSWDGTNQATFEAEHNTNSITDILSSFRRARFTLVKKLDWLDAPIVERSALHPRLQIPIRTIDLVYFIAEHDDYHFAEITRLKRALTA